MEHLAYFTHNILDPFGIWLGLILSVPIVWTWIDVVWGQRRRQRIWFRQSCQHTGRIPSVLILDLLPGRSAHTQVAHFMAQHEALKSIPQERMVVVAMDKTLSPTDMPLLSREIQNGVSKIAQLGVDELHVFLAAPVFASAMLGDELANAACKVHIYHNSPHQRDTYIDYGPLKHPMGF